MKYKTILLAIVIIFTNMFCVAEVNKNQNEKNKILIADIKKWKHPTKEIFLNNNFEIQKIELQANKTYPVFFVSDKENEKDKIYNYRILSELAEKNGFWDFKIVLDNNKYVEVYCDKTKKRVVKIKTDTDSIQYDSYSLSNAEKKAKELVIEKDKLVYQKKSNDYFDKEDKVYVVLISVGFDKYARYEIRVSPSDYPLSVYKYYYVNLKNEKIDEEP